MCSIGVIATAACTADIVRTSALKRQGDVCRLSAAAGTIGGKEGEGIWQRQVLEQYIVLCKCVASDIVGHGWVVSSDCEVAVLRHGQVCCKQTEVQALA